jgi:hypothetical protein
LSSAQLEDIVTKDIAAVSIKRLNMSALPSSSR